jgi:hypothetical protein
MTNAQRSLVLSLALTGTALATTVQPPQPVDAAKTEALLAGGWRYEPDGSAPPACDQAPGEMGQVISFEFAVTGGRAQWTSPEGEGMNLGGAVSQDGKVIALVSPDGPALTFEVNEDGTLSGLKMADFAGDLTGMQFRKCYDSADRAKIDGSAKALDFFGGAPDAPPVRFVDTRFAKKGKDLCLEPEAQYIQLDMVGPLGFTLARWNTAAIAEKLAAEENVKIALDDLGNYTLESLTPTGLGWEATVTELIPPNGSRGDTTTIRLQVKDDTLTIPEWQRDYLRCTTGDETTIVAQ